MRHVLLVAALATASAGCQGVQMKPRTARQVTSVALIVLGGVVVIAAASDNLEAADGAGKRVGFGLLGGVAIGVGVLVWP